MAHKMSTLKDNVLVVTSLKYSTESIIMLKVWLPRSVGRTMAVLSTVMVWKSAERLM